MSQLYVLQQFDSETAAKRLRLDAINEELGHNEHVQAAREVLDKASETQRARQAQVTDLELDIASLADKIKTAENRAYSGTVTNPRELEDLQAEIASLRRRREDLEGQLLEAMYTLEDNQAAVEEATRLLAEAEEQWASGQSDLLDEKRALEQRLESLETERAAAVERVDAPALRVYDDLRAQLGGVAVAAIEGGVCGACGVEPTSSVRQKASHGALDAYCQMCGRILVVT